MDAAALPDELERVLNEMPADRRALAETLAQRVLPLLADMLSGASVKALKRSLAAPTDAGSLARLLASEAVAEPVSTLDPLAEAFRRGAEMQEELLGLAGGAWSVSRVAEHLGVTRQAVDRRRQRGTLLAIEKGDSFLYPVCQFDATGVIGHLPEFLRAVDSESGWTMLSVLLSVTPTGREQTALDALRAGDLADALHAARTWGVQGAS